MIKWLLSWIDSYFQTESSRRQKARLYLASAGVKEGQIDALMKTIVPLSSVYGFDVLECCKVLADVAAKGKLLTLDTKSLMNMNFPILLALSHPYASADTQMRLIAERGIPWGAVATCICLYYDELQKN
jgi:hypothetical protein